MLTNATYNIESQKDQNKKAIQILKKAGLAEQFETQAIERNPYIERAIPYQISGAQTYLLDGESMTLDEINNEYLGTALRDMLNGYNERSAGWYDKWYRYSRWDGGWAYDFGQRIAQGPDRLNYIEIKQF